jgi:peptidoglycan hydrolase-like protein with peptidoglycan-binding domain
VLTLTNQDNAVGDFMTNPASALQPGDSTSFVFVQTPNQNDKSTSIQGSVTWDVGSPAVATWRCEWTNPAGQKNTAHGTVDPGSAGFKSLDQVDQGDENVPVAFTLLGGSQGPPVAPPVNPPNGPPVNPPDVPPQPPDGPEPEYKPPTEEKQPTLRQGDKSKDGWVEYLQQRLNRWVQPSPNLKEDGDFGPVTHKAVLAFQQQFGIQVDGVVGNQTWAALRRAPSEKPGTDGRQPHTFVDKGVKARWITEGRNAIYNTGSDTMTLKAVSVGTDTKLEGQKVNVFVTAPGGKRKGITPKLGPPTHKTDTGEGDEHEVVIPNFTKTFPSTPPGAAVTSYVVEAYFDGPLGGDYWTSATTQILVQ